MSAITFDFGQTLAELDHEMLCRRVSERGLRLDVERARAETPAAWRAYNEAKRSGLAGGDAWCTLMRTLVTRAGLCEADGATSASTARIDELASWLFEQQPGANLWRKPVPGMFELVSSLAAAGVPLGIVSNSEGRIAELCVELGIDRHFRAVADSGVLGIEKPDPKIFDYAAERLGVPTHDLIHIGDAWEADVVGALAAGARAVWFAPDGERALPDRVRVASDALELARVLASWGFPTA